MSQIEQTIRISNTVLPLNISIVGRRIVYVVVDFRIPARGELYLNKVGDIVRCKSVNFSRRARRKPICKQIK